MDMALRIFEHLKNKGIEVHFPAKKQGLCKSNYVVVKPQEQTGVGRSANLGFRGIDLIVFVPEKKPAQLFSFVKTVKGYMTDFTDVKRTGHETPMLYEDEIEAYSSSIEYVVHKKL